MAGPAGAPVTPAVTLDGLCARSRVPTTRPPNLCRRGGSRLRAAALRRGRREPPLQRLSSISRAGSATRECAETSDRGGIVPGPFRADSDVAPGRRGGGRRRRSRRQDDRRLGELLRPGLPRPADGERRDLRYAPARGGASHAAARYRRARHQPLERSLRGRADHRPGAVHQRPDPRRLERRREVARVRSGRACARPR